jgi:aminobenzoyl-glutamate transport protein
MKYIRKFFSKLIPGFLNFVEKTGNLLPHPATLFGILAVLVILLSWVAASLNLSVSHPTTGRSD